MRRLLTIEDSKDVELLGRKAKRVKNVQSTEVILGIQEMKKLARQWEHESGRRCEGLAATQIGWNARVIILRKSDEMSPKEPTPEMFLNDYGDVDLHDYMPALNDYREWMRCFGSTYDPWLTIINPSIIQSEGEVDSTEGCLSVPYGGYTVKRPTHVAFRFTMPNRTYSGIHLAKAENAIKLLHEIDHLNGKLISNSGLPIIGSNAERL